MIWQERQKLVCFERSMCSAAPKTPTAMGKTKSAKKARILPARPVVMPDATRSTSMRTTAIPSSVSSSAMGTVSPQPRMLLQGANVFNQGLDLVVSKFLVIGRHLVLALLGDPKEFFIGHLADLV